MKIGAQLYTLHDYCKTPEDFAETLKRVADMGYTAVQVSGTCAYEGEWLDEQLKKNGLICPLTHYDFKESMNNTEAVIEKHKKFGAEYIGLGGLPGMWDPNPDKTQFVLDFVEKGKPAMKKIRDAGMLYMYHNHALEYEKKIGDKTIMEYLGDAFTPEEMGFTLDVYWVKAGGYDPVAEINRLAGRLPCVHFKDMKIEADGKFRYTWVGDGVLDFEKIGDAAEKAGTEYAFIEQDATFPDEPNPFVCLANSRGYLKSLGFKF